MTAAPTCCPSSGLTKRQGRALLEHLGGPARCSRRRRPPTCWTRQPGQPDEADLGLRYADIDDYLEGREVAAEVARAIEARYRMTEHKRQPPLSMFDDWWDPSATYEPGDR